MPVTALPCRRLLAACLLLCALMAASHAAPAPVRLIELDGAISPVMAEHAVAGLQEAEHERAQLVVLRIDTPGGLDSAMRTIIKAILASPVPVAAFVAPAGARAASAGTYILYASHIAAMAPGTNVGAATPVALGAGGEKSTRDAHRDKAINDATAYLRSLAALRGRNADWAERAVRQADSIGADAALGLKVIDVVARDVPQLLQKLDGRRLSLPAGEVRLELAQAPLRYYAPTWRVRVLSVLSEPGLALMLVLAGLAGLFLEFSTPGLVVPGMLGAICLLLGMYALQMLPLDFAALGLLLLGVALLVGEAFLPSGLLAVGGVTAMVFAAVMLMDSGWPQALVPPAVVIAFAALVGVGIAVLMGVVVRSRRLAPVSGGAELIGATAVVIDPTPGNAWALLHGENWRISNDQVFSRGQQVRVIARDGLVLRVTAIDNDLGEP